MPVVALKTPVMPFWGLGLNPRTSSPGRYVLLTKATLALAMVVSGGAFWVSVTVRLGAIGVADLPWKKVSVPPVAGVRRAGSGTGRPQRRTIAG